MNRSLINKLCITTVLCIAILLTFDVALAKSRTSPPSRTAKREMDIQGYRIGLSINEVKKTLCRRGIKNYETGYSDLFVYPLSPDAEMRLSFACSAKGPILSRAELVTQFDVADTAVAMEKYREKLLMKYGKPSVSSSQTDQLDYCWGRCEQPAAGTILKARIGGVGNGKGNIVLALSNDALMQRCRVLMQKKINHWLYQWISFVGKFKPGMSLNAASSVYAARYKERPLVEDIFDENDPLHHITNFAITYHDYFDALNPDSQTFEGEGPGQIVLKFTGDQTGKSDRLSKRLYYSSFSTTKFANTNFADLTYKLDKFIKVYGRSTDVARREDSISAVWVRGTAVYKLDIGTSGLITLEQSDFSLRDSYRDRVIRLDTECRKKKFERNIF